MTTFQHWWLDTWPHRLYVGRHIPRFLQACPEPFRGQVLEVGAGTGWTSRAILETFPQVELTATDIDQRATKRFDRLQGQYGQRLKVQSADVQTLPFDRASFDVVVAFHMLHHVSDVATAIQQCIRVLRPGGFLGIASGHQLRQSMVIDLVTPEAEIRVNNKKRGEYYLWAQKAYPF